MSRHSASGRARAAWWPALIIVGAACAFCWPVFLGRIMLPADMCLLMLPWQHLQEQFGFHRTYNPMLDPIQQYLPWRIYAVESLREGIIPLWNPYAFCGTPFLANLQSTVLYPLNLLFLVTGARQGFGVSAIVHLTLGGLFMYAFLRALALSPAASLLGALVVMFNGWVVAWLEYPTLSLWVFMWLPALLLCYERALRQPRSGWPALCALAVGLQLLGGHLQISAYVLIAFALYAIARTASREERAAGRPAAIGLAVGAVIVGFALAAAQLLPTLELARETGREAQSAAAAVKTAFPLSHFILYLVPNFFGNPVDYNYWGDLHDPGAFNYFETACYVGILPLFLAVLSFSRKRSWRHWYFLALTLFAVLAAIGSPVYLLLYYLAPGFRELAGLGRALCLAAFGLAGMAAVGLDALLDRTTKAGFRLPVVIAAALCLAIVLARVGSQPDVKLLDSGWRFDFYLQRQVAVALALIALSAALISLRLRAKLGAPPAGVLACALVLADLFAIGLRFNPFTEARMAYPETEAIGWLQQHAGHDRVTSLADKTILDWMPPNAAMAFGLRDIHGSDSLRVRQSFELVSGPELDQMHYPPPDSPYLDWLGVKYLMTRQPVGEGWRLARGGGAPIYENAEAIPRARLDRAGSAEFRDDSRHHIAIGTRGDAPAALFLRDSAYPGWNARVDGKPVPVELPKVGFRSVAVPAGEHTVEFWYEPATFRVGLFVSLVACAALAGVAICVWLGNL